MIENISQIESGSIAESKGKGGRTDMSFGSWISMVDCDMATSWIFAAGALYHFAICNLFAFIAISPFKITYHKLLSWCRPNIPDSAYGLILTKIQRQTIINVTRESLSVSMTGLGLALFSKTRPAILNDMSSIKRFANPARHPDNQAVSLICR
jgi:hypothetical protein